jgi:hypothetical protein
MQTGIVCSKNGTPERGVMLCIISHAGFLAAVGNVKHNKSNSIYSRFRLKSCLV